MGHVQVPPSSKFFTDNMRKTLAKLYHRPNCGDMNFGSLIDKNETWQELRSTLTN